MSKYRSVTVYYPPDADVADGNLGRYIHELFNTGTHVVQIVRGRKPHDHEHLTVTPQELVYTNIQGNVGSS